MKHKTWIYGGSALAALSLAVAWALAPRPVEVELAAVSEGPFETSIEEDGKTRVADRYIVSVPLSGRLARIALREGDAVAAQETLAQLTPTLPAMLDQRTLSELQARLQAAEARVEQTGTRIARAQVALTLAQNEARRSEQLARQGFIAPTKLESDRLSSLAARKEVESAVDEQHVASHELEQARAALGFVQAPAVRSGRSGGAFTVRSPVAGRVLRLLQTSEATVALGTPLMELGDTSRLEIVADLLTTDALAASPGSHVYIERWGGVGSLQGQVLRVEPAAFTKVSALGVEEQRVRVVIALTSPPEQWAALGDGYRVGLRIVTLAQAKALQVPVSAVFPLPEQAGRFAVFVARGGRALQTPVTVLARNANTAWIERGVAAKDQVIVYPPNTVSDGARIAPRRV